MMNLTAYCVWLDDSREAVSGGLDTQKTAMQSLKGNQATSFQSQKLLLTKELGDNPSFSCMSKPKFREVKTFIQGHTASKWYLLDLNLDLAHPKAPRLKLLVWSFSFHLILPSVSQNLL